MNYSDFYNLVIGKAFDIDKYYGTQCWDGYAKYCIENGVPYDNCVVSGYVKDIYNQKDSNNLKKYFDETYYMQAGDLCFFKEVANWTPLSHVAIFHSDAGDGYGWFLGQNQGGKNGAFNLAKLPYSATYYYAFRLKSTGAGEQIDPNGVEEIDQILHVGSYVTSCPMKIGNEGLKVVNGEQCCYLADLGNWYPISKVSEYDNSDGAKDNYLANTNAVVYLDRAQVTKVDIVKDMVLVNGVWVNAKPLIEVK